MAKKVLTVGADECLGTFVKTTESGKHACVILRRNAFDTKGTVGYVRNNAALDSLEKGDEFTAPAGWSTEQKEDEEGNVMVTKDGEPLTFFVW